MTKKLSSIAKLKGFGRIQHEYNDKACTLTKSLNFVEKPPQT